MMAAAAADTAGISDPSQQNLPSNKEVQVVFLCLCNPHVGPGHPFSPFPLTHLLPHLLLFYVFFSFIGFTYLLFCPSLPFLPE